MKQLLVITCILALSWGGCAKRTVKLDRDMLRAIDTIAAKQINVLRPQLDSLCDARFDSLVAVAMDSIMVVRQLERAKILGVQ